jgi:hypothetical protein
MWPKLSNIDGGIYQRTLQKSKPIIASTLMPWIRVFSGAVVGGSNGLIMSSNNLFQLFKAAGQNSATVYGGDTSSGLLGINWDGVGVGGGSDRGYRPSPIITGFDVKEGTDQISREGNLQIKCFSLYQLTLLQKYFMEPGYSLCVEWGWNSVAAAKRMIDDGGGIEGILSETTDVNLDYEKLHSKRTLSFGDYDSYLGFIVGCSVKSDGENFVLDVKMKGSPSLPTFMQTQGKIQETDDNGTVVDAESPDIFGADELTADVGGNETSGPRRFKKMFNDLPASRQLTEIRNKYSNANWYDFVNFDAYVLEQITDFADGGNFFTIGDGGDSVEGPAGAEIKKDGFISDKKYIRMGLLVDILNTNGGFDGIQLGNIKLTTKIDISNAVIGAFPKMYSTNPDKLIIPGEIPDFSTYYLNSSKVEQKDNGILSTAGTDAPPVDTAGDFGSIRFVQQAALSSNGLNENAGYWGYLKNLYVNFDVFKTAIESKNKTIREVFTDILNECSSAVNSFWNFQIQEETKANTVVYTVVDENWIGSKPADLKPKEFYHSGENSVFLSADLDMSIPAQMVSQIVTRRLNSTMNQDEPIVGLGTLFSDNVDLFTKAIQAKQASQPQEPAPEPEKKPSETTADTVASLQTQQEALKKEANTLNINPLDVGAKKAAQNSVRLLAIQAELAAIEVQQVALNLLATGQEISESIDAAAAAEKAAAAQVTENLKKLTILPKPKLRTLDTIVNDTILVKENAMQKFGFYTFKDEGYFDRLRNNAFAKNKGSGKLSHPLPIKYSFTILGTSGLRRGDTFNIIGIPNIYREQGLFQIINVSHQIEGMSWTTNVEGQYRQKQ